MVKIKIEFLLFLIVFVFIAACRQNENNRNSYGFIIERTKIVISLIKVKEDVFIIQAETFLENGSLISEWKIDYPVFRFECGDITGDGIPEIVVGIIKPPRFDQEIQKRLFLYKLYDLQYVRPLWLGSKMPMPLEDFTIKNGLIRTIEQDSENTFAVADYKYKSSGPEFFRYIKKGVSKKEAAKRL